MADANFTPEKNITITTNQHQLFLARLHAVDLMLNGMLGQCDAGMNLARIDVDALRGVFDPLHTDFIKLEDKMEAGHDNTDESRAGAMACMNALRVIEQIGDRLPLDTSEEGWWQAKESMVTAMLNAAKVESEFMAGFLAVFAEYASATNSAGVPDLYRWKPEAEMSSEEIAASRKATFELLS
jgi:hypothetical protein